MILRSNGKLRALLDAEHVRFLEHGLSAVTRLFPYLEIVRWWECDIAPLSAVEADNVLTLTVPIASESANGGRALVGAIRRRSQLKLAEREVDVCRLIGERIAALLSAPERVLTDKATVNAMIRAFDGEIVASHLQEHHGLHFDVAGVFSALHTLSEQSYENKSLTFGCLIDSKNPSKPDGVAFPSDFLVSKKYKALSDGFRTAYLVSSRGRMMELVNLDRYNRKNKSDPYFPDWAELMAKASRGGKCGISLNRQGDILVFEDGNLRFSYRYGRWQYWDHEQVINLLRQAAKVQKVPKDVLGRVVGSIYRAALDVSFRRSGAMFVVLRALNRIDEIVRDGDAIGNTGRSAPDVAFDRVYAKRFIQTTPRPVIVELASLDGSIVIANSGEILAFGAVLSPSKSGRLRGTEGSRTKAAIGASYSGLTVKVSSDGDISVYQSGKPLIQI